MAGSDVSLAGVRPAGRTSAMWTTRCPIRWGQRMPSDTEGTTADLHHLIKTFYSRTGRVARSTVARRHHRADQHRPGTPTPPNPMAPAMFPALAQPTGALDLPADPRRRRQPVPRAR